jgi:O-antigen/teichoic acid export membrane protein
MLVALKTIGAFVLMPFIIRTLGTDKYGIWILISSVTGYLTLLMMGAPMTSLRYLAEAIALKDNKSLNEYVASFFGMYLAVGAASLLIGAGLYFSLPSLFAIPPELLYQTKVAFILVVFSTAAGFNMQLPYSIFYAHHEFVLANLILACSTALKLALTFVLLSWSPSIVTVAGIQLGMLLFEYLCARTLIRKKYPEIRFGIKDFKWARLKEIFAFNLFVMFLNIGGQLSYQTDSLVIGGFIGVGLIAPFTVASSLTLYFMEFLLGIAAVVMPMATKLQAESNMEKLREVFLRWSRIALALTVVGCAYLMFFGPRFLAWWVGRAFEGSAGEVLQILVLSYLLFLPVRAVAQPILTGLGLVAKPALAFLIAGAVNLGLSIALAIPYGLVGVAIGTAIPNAIYAAYLAAATCRAVDLPVRVYVAQVFFPAVAASIPLLILLYLMRYVVDLNGFSGLMSSGIVTVIVWAALWALFVFRKDELMVRVFSVIRKRLPI